MADDRNDGPGHEMHVIVFELAQVAEVIRGCSDLLSSHEQDEDARRLGAILERAAKDLWELRRRLRDLAPPASSSD